MGLTRWFTKNWANTTEPTHTDLRPLEWPEPPSQFLERVRRLTGRWRVVSTSPEQIVLTRTTPVFRFVDDVILTITPTTAGCQVHATSRSRVGVGDLGQNRRNILELWAKLGG